MVPGILKPGLPHSHFVRWIDLLFWHRGNTSPVSSARRLVNVLNSQTGLLPHGLWALGSGRKICRTSNR